jgi:DNA-binding transcriptional LysR family regulator
LRDLHIVLAVAQRRSISKAAEHLAISHPVVSKTIADLEHTLGVRLFDRSSRGAEPTKYGCALIRSSQAVFDELRQGIQNIECLADPTHGELRIGTNEPMAAGLTLAIVARLSEQHPGMLCDVIEADDMTLERELRERKIELVVGRFRQPKREDYLDLKLLLDERYCVVAGIHNGWAGKRKIALAELIHEPWILPAPEGIAGSQIRDAFLASGVEPPRPRVTISSISLRIGLLATGRFLSVLLSPLAEVFIGCARQIVDPIADEADERDRGQIASLGKRR